MSTSDDNTIEIATENLEIELRGDEEAVAEAYAALRGIVFDLDEADAVDASGPDGETESSATGDTKPMHELEESAEAAVREDGDPDFDQSMSAAVRALTPEDGERDAGAFIQLILRRARYHKVHLLERRDFDDSFLGRSMDPTHISRIYTDTRTEERLRKRLEFGDTIWRELTEQGRAEVEGEWSELETSAPEDSAGG